MSDEAHNHLRLVPPPEGPLVDAPSWVRRLRGIQDSHLRLHRLSSLVETDPALFGELFEHVRVRLGEEQPRTIYLDLVRLLSGAAPVRYAVRERLYVRARTRNVPVLRLLLVKAVTRPAGDVDHLPDPTLRRPGPPRDTARSVPPAGYSPWLSGY